MSKKRRSKKSEHTVSNNEPTKTQTTATPEPHAPLAKNTNSTEDPNDTLTNKFNATPQVDSPASGQPLDWTHDQGHKPINPLLDWASPILALVPRLANPIANAQLPQLHQKLCEQIRHIENQMHQHSYAPQQTLAIRYVLSALIDEIILHSAWGKRSQWEKYSLLDVFQRDRWQADEFFQILQHAAEHPQKNINFLELCYLTLQLGFRGRYRQQSEHSDSLKIITKNLYQLIAQQRYTARPAQNPQTQKNFFHPTPSLRWSWLILIPLLSIGLIKSYYALREHHLNTKLMHTLEKMSTNTQKHSNKKGTIQ